MAEVSTASAGLKFKYIRATFGPKFPGSSYRVLIVYWDHARADLTHSHPKRATVIREAGISGNTFDAAIKWLRANGWLTLEKEASGTFTNRYALTVPAGIEWEGSTSKVGVPQGTDTSEVGGSPEVGSPSFGGSDSPSFEVETPQVLGGHNRPLNRSFEETLPPTPTAPVQQEQGPATAGGEDFFKEWIELLPTSKRKDLPTARRMFAEAITSGATAQQITDGTRAYIDRENNRTDNGQGGKFISKAVAILEGEKWRTPNLSTAEAITEAGRLQRQMKDLRAAGDETGATALFESKLKPILDKHGLVPDEWNLGYKKQSTFDPTKWML